jgi:hypothetical protein
MYRLPFLIPTVMLPYAPMRERLIALHQGCQSDDISVQDDCKLA